jgi:hypothetical protein
VSTQSPKERLTPVEQTNKANKGAAGAGGGMTVGAGIIYF